MGAPGAIAIAAVLGSLPRKMVVQIFDNTARTTAVFILLIICGPFSAFVLAHLGIPRATAKFLVEPRLALWVTLGDSG